MVKLIRRIGYTVGLPVVLIAVWWWLSGSSSSPFVPKPPQLAGNLVDIWFGDRFTSDVVPSLVRLLAGIVISIILGVLIGLLIGISRRLRMALEPTLEFLRAIPPPAIIPIWIILLGITDSMRITVIVAGSIWPLLLNTVEGVRSLDSVLAETCDTYRVTRMKRLRYFIFPGTLPHIMAGIRQSLSIALILMVISEMFGSTSGLGFTIVLFERSFAVQEMWSGIALLGIIGFILASILKYVEPRILHWYYGMREGDDRGLAKA